MCNMCMPGFEGKKLVPFLNKRYITIPTAKEETYFEKFVAPLIEKYHVYAEGFDIRTEKHEPSAILKVIYVEGGVSQLQLYFKYGEYVFALGNEKKVTVHVEKQENNYVFTRVKRDTTLEKYKYAELLKLGLKKVSPLFYNLELNATSEGDDASYGVLNWVNEHIELLKEKGYAIEQSTGNKKFLFASSKIDFEIKEDNELEKGELSLELFFLYIVENA